jgi:hypothetical protein
MERRLHLVVRRDALACAPAVRHEPVEGRMAKFFKTCAAAVKFLRGHPRINWRIFWRINSVEKSDVIMLLK